MLPHLDKDKKVVEISTGKVGEIKDMLVHSHDCLYDIEMEDGRFFHRTHGITFKIKED